VRGEIKEISSGYARNFIIPRKLGVEANAASMKTLENEQKKIAKQREQEVQLSKELAEKMEKASFTVTVKAGEGGKLFGSVTNADIAKALEEKGFLTINITCSSPTLSKRSVFFTLTSS